MSRRRFAWLLAAALVAISGAIYLSSQRNLPRETQDAPLLPKLAQDLNSVTALSVRKGSAANAVTLHHVSGQWTVAERGDYPADVIKLRRLLLDMADLKIVEAKTSNPASFAVIGVEDPSSSGAAGSEITVTAPQAKYVLIVGKPVGQGSFARRGGENQSYIVQPALSIASEPRSWIDPKLIDIASTAIQSIAVKPAAGAGYTLHRLIPAEPGFSLDGVPAGRKALDAKDLEPSPGLLSNFTAEDVAKPADVDFSSGTQAVITQADGNVLTLTGATVGDKRWIQITATKDSALNAKAQGRAFEVASYRYDAIFRPAEQLLVPKPPPPAKPAPAVKPAPAAKAKLVPPPAPGS
jgi:Domain of unknown function (DUF4340)